MKQKMIEFLELHDELPADFEIEIIAEDEKRIDFVEMAGNIAPEAVNKLMEAVELLERVIAPKENVLDERVLRDDIKQFLEDFNND